MKGIVVSAITNNYSRPRSVVKPNKDWEYYMLVDNEEFAKEVPQPWKPIVLEGLQDRAPKFLTHRFFQGWDHMIWVDGSVTLIEDPDLIIQTMGDSDILVRKHTRCKTAMDDIDKCIVHGKIDGDKGIRAFIDVLNANLPERYFEMGFFARRNTPEVNETFEAWASEYERMGIKRDQPAFAKVVRGNVRVIDPYKLKFIHAGWHASENLHTKPMKNKIHYITLLNDTKSVAGYVHPTIDGIPDDHWICLTDADSMFLQSDDGVFLSKIVEAHPDTHIFGCMTNRQGLIWQVLEHNQENNPDMTYHERTAELQRLKWGIWSPIINIPVAGQFMLFPKWLIKEFPFQEKITEVDIDGKQVYFDWNFCQRILEAGGRVRLIKGMYRYHHYRMVKGKQNVTHLKP